MYNFNNSNCLSSTTHKVGNQILSLLLLLDTCEDHLGARNILLGTLQVGEEGVLTPGDTLGDVGLRVGEVGGLTSGTTDEPVKVRALLVTSSGLDGVALTALSLENFSSLGDVSHDFD